LKISIIIPSRLQAMPGAEGRLWLDRSIPSVRAQVLPPGVELEIVVGLDAGVHLPERFAGVRWAAGNKAGQAFAVNAAAAAASGDLLAFLEDDDYWQPTRLALGLARLERCDLVTASQRKVTPEGEFIQMHDYPMPSGWLLRRSLWDRLGPFDDSLRYHVDTEYLGRINERKLRRLHFVEKGGVVRPQVRRISRFSSIEELPDAEPLVTRTVHPGSGMYSINHEGAAHSQSDAEREVIRRRYGDMPW
jgi:glycosyltransferase involved in cell wall biosynthesis